jgi:endonuclease/exonuclease/phosphatase family metal-dependent hydrolase
MHRMLSALPVAIAALFYLSLNGIDVENTFALPHSNQNDDSFLTVVTYNIRGCRDNRGEADVLAIAEELKKLDADIIALQEVDNRLPRSHFVNQAKVIAEYLQMNYVFAPSIDFVIGTYGNAVISRYPILSSQVISLPYSLEPRTLLDVTINLFGSPFHVYTTHLGLKKSERTKQFECLHQYLSEKKGDSGVLLGDFNTRPGDPLFVPLRRLFQDPLFARKQELVTINGSRTYGMIDHVFLSPDLTLKHAYSVRTGPSDHYPLCFLLEPPTTR